MVANPSIAIGDVFLLRCTLCVPPKDKFFVVVHIDPLRMFLINSEANAFQKASASLMAAQALISASEHSFLRHDSLIGCDHLSHEYGLEKLQKLLALTPNIRLGHLSDRAKDAVRQALRGNNHIPRKYLRDMEAYWGN